jgi:uncharacterized membrane protein YeaQ/YmgE (transglycosylase-associated protein family)
MKLNIRTFVLVFMGTVGTFLAGAGLLVPATAFGEDNMSINILSNLRAFTGAEVLLALFALYSLSNKKYQEPVLIFLLLTFIGWTIGQVLSYVVDGAPSTATTGSIIIQALFIPLTWAALKQK